eukprot:3344308-Prymnesium_polylepis.3
MTWCVLCRVSWVGLAVFADVALCGCGCLRIRYARVPYSPLRPFVSRTHKAHARGRWCCWWSEHGVRGILFNSACADPDA